MKYFSFIDQIANKKYLIPLLSCPPEAIDVNTADDWYQENVLPILEPLEYEYGIHDFNTYGPDELFGYTSYEVNVECTGHTMEELMEVWKSKLKELGFTIGEMFVVDPPPFRGWEKP